MPSFFIQWTEVKPSTTPPFLICHRACPAVRNLGVTRMRPSSYFDAGMRTEIVNVAH